MYINNDKVYSNKNFADNLRRKWLEQQNKQSKIISNQIILQKYYEIYYANVVFVIRQIHRNNFQFYTNFQK